MSDSSIVLEPPPASVECETELRRELVRPEPGVCRVLKFGGSSVGGAEAMRRVAGIVESALPHAPLVVLSAMGKTTDVLLEAAQAAVRGDLDEALRIAELVGERHHMAAVELFGSSLPRTSPRVARRGYEQALCVLDHELTRLTGLLTDVATAGELTPPLRDAILATGEFLSTRLFATFLGADWFDVRTVMRTDRCFGAARPDREALADLVAEKLVPCLVPGLAVVTQGYVGAGPDGETTTLGRGGSDYTATLLGAALTAEEVQIWTDVAGVHSADPRVVPAAVPIRELSYAEAGELAAFGARVLHPTTLEPVADAGIPVTVRDSRRPDGPYTTISRAGSCGRAITAIASRAPVTVLTVRTSRMLAESGFLARLFEPFGRRGVSVDLVATAEVSVSLTVDDEAPIADLVAELGRFADVDTAPGRAIVAVVGERMRSTPGIAARLFTALDDLNVEMVSMGANEINLSMVVREEDAREAVRRLHRVIEEWTATEPVAGKEWA